VTQHDYSVTPRRLRLVTSQYLPNTLNRLSDVTHIDFCSSVLPRVLTGLPNESFTGKKRVCDAIDSNSSLSLGMSRNLKGRKILSYCHSKTRWRVGDVTTLAHTAIHFASRPHNCCYSFKTKYVETMHAKHNRHYSSRQQYHNKGPNTLQHYWDLFTLTEWIYGKTLWGRHVRPSATWCQNRFGLTDFDKPSNWNLVINYIKKQCASVCQWCWFSV